MHVVLFDIDGTLVRTGGAGKAAMEEALRSVFGLREVKDGVPYAGRTDRAIARDLLALHGIYPQEENIRRLQEAYLQLLPEMLRQRGGTVCPAVPEVLQKLSATRGVLLGLLTGNIRLGAQRKLQHFGLWDYFAGGGFGDEYEDRDDVARSALQNLGLTAGVPPGSGRNIWVVGDTPLDIRSARAIGAQAVAVATGWHSLEALSNHNPDWLFPDLYHARSLLTIWCQESNTTESDQDNFHHLRRAGPCLEHDPGN
jgi:phosphoglycolate phosphatase-like HAD superfamily hydrolase